jgi:8-oxo-dGTP diphosphatase
VGHDGRVRLIVVRHGQAGRKAQWVGDDALRPLGPKGRQQAQDLIKSLGRQQVTRIVSSPYLRCLQTVEPLSRKFKVAVEVDPSLAPDAGVAAAAALEVLVSTSRHTVVLCTHREVLVELLPLLARRFDIRLGHRLPGAKGGQWILQFSTKQALTSVKYQGPRR